MNNYEAIIELADSEAVEYGVSLPKFLGTKLILGQSRYVCRYGTLSDGHEKFTPAQRYYQALKEIYYLSQNIKEQRAVAMMAQADILDAGEALDNKEAKQSERLRAEAKLLRARTQLAGALTTVKDQIRMVDEYNKVRMELQEQVDTQYPLGIEQSEEDSWRAVFEYRMLKQRGTQQIEQIANIPLAPEAKAELGYKTGRLDAIAPLLLSNPEACKQIAADVEAQMKIEHLPAQAQENN